MSTHAPDCAARPVVTLSATKPATAALRSSSLRNVAGSGSGPMRAGELGCDGSIDTLITAPNVSPYIHSVDSDSQSSGWYAIPKLTGHLYLNRANEFDSRTYRSLLYSASRSRFSMGVCHTMP